MIDYVDRVLRHWAQEMSVHRPGVNLGYGNAWRGGMFAEGVQVRNRRLTARGTASRTGPVLTDIGKVAERVNQAVERLPKALQEVVNVQYLEYSGYTKAQKADVLGCSEKTLYANIHRAHELLSADLPDAYAKFRTTYPHCG